MIRRMILVFGLAALAGCGGPEVSGGKSVAVETKATGGAGHDEEWWCNEHGVKEVECSMCQAKVRKKMKPEDYCPKHPDRAKSQCFICNPEEWPKSAAIYRAKFGKEPPEPKDNMPGGK